MEHLFPRLPLEPDETALSWASHLAALHTRGPLQPFLNDFGITIVSILSGKAQAFQRLAEITGECETRVLSSAVIARDRATYRFRGEDVSPAFLVGRAVRFCPQCILEDRLSGGSRARSPRYRPAWESSHVRVCEHHGLPLITRKDCRDRELAALTDTNADLEKAVEVSVQRRPTQLQEYLLSRMGLSAGGRGNFPWMDDQPIHQAARATEILGVLLEFGPKRDLRTLSDSEWDVAGDAGWEFTKDGPSGIHAALEIAHGRFAVAGTEHFPGKVFQLFHRFICNINSPAGPIRDAALEYYRSSMAICPRRECLGKVLQLRQRHSIGTLSVLSGVSTRNVQLILKRAGLRSRQIVGVAPDLTTFDAIPAERAVLRTQERIFLDEASDILGASKELTEVLADGDHLKVVTAVSGTKAWTGRAVLRNQVKALRLRVEKQVPVVEEPPAGFVMLQHSNGTAGRSFREIVGLFADGRLQRAVRLQESPGLEGVMIDPQELSWLADPDLKMVSLTEGFRRLAVPPAVGRLLISTECGPALLPSVNMAKAPWFDENRKLREDELLAFMRTYATIAHLSKETGHRKGKIRPLLDAHGIKPVVRPGEIGVELYRRADLPDGWMD